MNGLRKASLGAMIAAAAMLTSTAAAFASTPATDPEPDQLNITQSNTGGSNQSNIIGSGNTVNQTPGCPSTANEDTKDDCSVPGVGAGPDFRQFVATNTNMCLTAVTQSPLGKTPTLSGCANTSPQHWEMLTGSQRGNTNFHNEATGLCLQANTNNTVTQQNCTGNANQYWTDIRVSPTITQEGGWVIRSTGNRCIARGTNNTIILVACGTDNVPANARWHWLPRP